MKTDPLSARKHVAFVAWGVPSKFVMTQPLDVESELVAVLASHESDSNSTHALGKVEVVGRPAMPANPMAHATMDEDALRDRATPRTHMSEDGAMVERTRRPPPPLLHVGVAVEELSGS